MVWLYLAAFEVGRGSSFTEHYLPSRLREGAMFCTFRINLGYFIIGDQFLLNVEFSRKSGTYREKYLISLEKRLKY
jgi:hypothetical protein